MNRSDLLLQPAILSTLKVSEAVEVSWIDNNAVLCNVDKGMGTMSCALLG